MTKYLIGFAAILFGAAAFTAYAMIAEPQVLAEINEPAPDFTLIDSNGETHTLSEYEGKYVVLEWINFDCPFVKKHYNSDNMQNLQGDYTGQDVIWLSICSSASGKQGYFETAMINEKISGHDAAMTAYLIDESGDVGRMYGAKTTPHMYIISPDGILFYAGAIDSIKSADEGDIDDALNYVDRALTEHMGGLPISNSVTQPYGCSVKY